MIYENTYELLDCDELIIIKRVIVQEVNFSNYLRLTCDYKRAYDELVTRRGVIVIDDVNFL